jgi:hypothetical protein
MVTVSAGWPASATSRGRLVTASRASGDAVGMPDWRRKAQSSAALMIASVVRVRSLKIRKRCQEPKFCFPSRATPLRNTVPAASRSRRYCVRSARGGRLRPSNPWPLPDGPVRTSGRSLRPLECPLGFRDPLRLPRDPATVQPGDRTVNGRPTPSLRPMPIRQRSTTTPRRWPSRAHRHSRFRPATSRHRHQPGGPTRHCGRSARR